VVKKPDAFTSVTGCELSGHGMSIYQLAWECCLVDLRQPSWNPLIILNCTAQYKAQKEVTEETIGKTQKESPYCFHLAKLRVVLVVPRHYSITVSDW